MKRTIFVFGSNRQGIHGAGAAKHALDSYGAELQNPIGLQGDSYAIVTKDLTKGDRSVSLEYIDKQIKDFHVFTLQNPELVFIVTGIGMGLAGFRRIEIVPLFMQWNWGENVFFNKDFL